jgi:hypothetical protein
MDLLKHLGVPPPQGNELDAHLVQSAQARVRGEPGVKDGFGNILRAMRGTSGAAEVTAALRDAKPTEIGGTAPPALEPKATASPEMTISGTAGEHAVVPETAPEVAPEAARAEALRAAYGHQGGHRVTRRDSIGCCEGCLRGTSAGR